MFVLFAMETPDLRVPKLISDFNKISHLTKLAI